MTCIVTTFHAGTPNELARLRCRATAGPQCSAMMPAHLTPWGSIWAFMVHPTATHGVCP